MLKTSTHAQGRLAEPVEHGQDRARGLPRRRLLVLDLNQRIPLESATPAALVAGYRQGWLRMLEELDAWLASLKPDNTSAGHS